MSLPTEPRAGEVQVALPQAAQLLVDRLNMLRCVAVHTMQGIQANILETLYELHGALDGDEVRYRGALADYVPWLEPDKGMRLLTLWQRARTNKNVRELAHQAPDQALQLLDDLASAPLEIDPDGELDAELSRILTLPSNRRNKELRRLVAVDQDVRDGRHPADRERIRTLEAERDAALEELEAARGIISLPRKQYADWCQDTDEVLEAVRAFMARSIEALTSLRQSADDALVTDINTRVLALEDELDNAGATLVGVWSESRWQGTDT